TEFGTTAFGGYLKGTPQEFWRFSSTNGAATHVDLSVGQWYTVETVVQDDGSGPGGMSGSGKLLVTYKVWNQAHTGMPLWSWSESPSFLAPAGGFPMSQVGGPRRSWFTHWDGFNHIF